MASDHTEHYSTRLRNHHMPHESGSAETRCAMQRESLPPPRLTTTALSSFLHYSVQVAAWKCVPTTDFKAAEASLAHGIAYLTDTSGVLSSPVGSTFLCLMVTSYCEMRARAKQRPMGDLGKDARCTKLLRTHFRDGVVLFWSSHEVGWRDRSDAICTARLQDSTMSPRSFVAGTHSNVW